MRSSRLGVFVGRTVESLLLRPAFLVVAVALFAAACSTSSDPTTSASSAGNTARGEALYASSCASCHGSDLRGTDRGPSHLSIVYEPNHHGDDAFRSAMINGATQHHWNFGAMPPIAGLDDDDREAIIDYIRSVQEREGFER